MDEDSPASFYDLVSEEEVALQLIAQYKMDLFVRRNPKYFIHGL